jgi:hypothetical protein
MKLELNIVLPTEVKTSIIEYAKDETKRYELSRNWYQTKIPEEIVQDIVSSINLEPTAIILLHSEPFLMVPRHTDTRMADHGWRTALTWAMYPDLAHVSPSQFYLPAYTHHYTEKCFVFDTWRPHSMMGNQFPRGLFQMRYRESPEELIAAINNNGEIS